MSLSEKPMRHALPDPRVMGGIAELIGVDFPAVAAWLNDVLVEAGKLTRQEFGDLCPTTFPTEKTRRREGNLQRTKK